MMDNNINNNNYNNSASNSNSKGKSKETIEVTAYERNNNNYNTNNFIHNQYITIATHNVRGFNDPIKRKFFFNFIKSTNTDIVGIAETNIKEPSERWFIEGNSKFRIHWSSSRMGAGKAPHRP